jgi:uncharacterized protein YqjF (DUF2071 family)/RimJ/RimL family protein N-acetyltransferase
MSAPERILPMPERPFLTAEWRFLAMLQWEVEPGVLRPFVPRGTELDDWQGRALVSLVGFRFLQTRVMGATVPFHRSFDEVNLRFYVRRRSPEGWRRAVVFIREIVPRRAIAAVARLWYNEPYIALPMRHVIDMNGAAEGTPGRARYEWRHLGRWSRLEVETEGAPTRPSAGSEAEFVSEHYWGYTTQRDGGCLEYQVTHAPWRVWAVRRASLDCEVDRLYGAPFARFLGAPPRSAFLAEGSPVAVFRGRRLPHSADAPPATRDLVGPQPMDALNAEPPHISFRPLTPADLPFLHEWLARPHVAEWWGRPSSLMEVEQEYGPLTSDRSTTRPYIALSGGVPIGYIQSYVAMGAGEGWWPDEEGPGVRGIDQFLANSGQLDHGVGTAMVRAFVQHLFADPAVTRIQTDPSPANARAIRCYEKAGFRAVCEVDTPDGRALLMICDREGSAGR